jgi:dTDP-4-amino-4,6-dideoxy-D-galactose acyltransferase
LSDLAARSHYDSRFYADGRFPKDGCDRLFRTWIERSCTDHSFAQAVFVPEVEGKPAGYITLGVKNGIGDIGLIAVEQCYRGQGIGNALLFRSLEWFRNQGVRKVEVVTQGRNINALRMYEKAGFRLESMRLWFHWWRS